MVESRTSEPEPFAQLRGYESECVVELAGFQGVTFDGAAPRTWLTLGVRTPRGGAGLDLDAEKARRLAAALLNAADWWDQRSGLA